jgi:hypothetical protein
VHAVDLLLACAAVLVLGSFAAIIARQRYMMTVAGGQPVALRARSGRWIYGIGRYAEGQLRWYRAFGLGSRPSRVLDRSRLTILGHRPRDESEQGALPAGAVVVECRSGDLTSVLAFSESGFTGFVSWLEAAAPRF